MKGPHKITIILKESKKAEIDFVKENKKSFYV